MYEGKPLREQIHVDALKPDPDRTSRVLKLGEVNEQIRSMFYKLEEEN